MMNQRSRTKAHHDNLTLWSRLTASAPDAMSSLIGAALMATRSPDPPQAWVTRQGRCGALAWIGGWTLCLLLALTGTASAQIFDPPCGTVINTPGETVIYTSDLNCAGVGQPLLVAASEVTVDGGGFTLTGDNGDGIGVGNASSLIENVVIENVTLEGCNVGIFVLGTDDFPTFNTIIQGVTIVGGQQGINFRNATFAVIERVTIRDTLNDAVTVSDVNTSGATSEVGVFNSLFENIGGAGVATGPNRAVSGVWTILESEFRGCSRAVALQGDGTAGFLAEENRFEVRDAVISLSAFETESYIQNNRIVLGPTPGQRQFEFIDVNNADVNVTLCAGDPSQIGVYISGTSEGNIIQGNFGGFATAVSIQAGASFTEVAGAFGDNGEDVQNLGADSLIATAPLLDSDNDGVNDACDQCQGDDDSGDSDGDLVCDDIDNCPDVPNPDQEDIDNDDIGDACPVPDLDGDGILDNVDNCLETPNFDQADLDNDNIGDACDDDIDGDDVPDIEDNCPLDDNFDQADFDNDNIGDVCDIDADGDAVIDQFDNCLLLSNYLQLDLDGDLEGDDCDDDIDGDDVPNSEDNCPLDDNADQSDLDNDEIGDACDDDSDNDSVPDLEDNCPLDDNADQADLDNDQIGDVCDDDIDGDGIGNDVEASLMTNPANADSDGDGLDDAQELALRTDPNQPDSDGDGVNDGDEVNDGTNPTSNEDDPNNTPNNEVNNTPNNEVNNTPNNEVNNTPNDEVNNGDGGDGDGDDGGDGGEATPTPVGGNGCSTAPGAPPTGGAAFFMLALVALVIRRRSAASR